MSRRIVSFSEGICSFKEMLDVPGVVASEVYGARDLRSLRT
jgi:hypothetical protein